MSSTALAPTRTITDCMLCDRMTSVPDSNDDEGETSSASEGSIFSNDCPSPATAPASALANEASSAPSIGASIRLPRPSGVDDFHQDYWARAAPAGGQPQLLPCLAAMQVSPHELRIPTRFPSSAGSADCHALAPLSAELKKAATSVASATALLPPVKAAVQQCRPLSHAGEPARGYLPPPWLDSDGGSPSTSKQGRLSLAQQRRHLMPGIKVLGAGNARPQQWACAHPDIPTRRCCDGEFDVSDGHRHMRRCLDARWAAEPESHWRNCTPLLGDFHALPPLHELRAEGAVSYTGTVPSGAEDNRPFADEAICRHPYSQVGLPALTAEGYVLS